MERQVFLTEDKWDLRFLSLAHLASTWSKDDSTQVGAAITDQDRRVVSIGFNGYPKGVVDQILSREQKLLRTVHAEANALHFANRDVHGCSIYITHPPCCNCAAHIVQRGISRVVFYTPSPYFLERWGDSFQESLRMFKEAGVIALHHTKESEND